MAEAEERLFTSVVLRPEVADSHNHIYSHDVVKNACYDYAEYSRNAAVLEHFIQLETEDVVMVENFIAPTDYTIDGKDVLKGDWVATVRVNNDAIWDACKDGTFKAFSIGCKGSFETEEE